MYDISYVVKWSSAFKKHKNALGSCNKYNSFDQQRSELDPFKHSFGSSSSVSCIFSAIPT